MGNLNAVAQKQNGEKGDSFSGANAQRKMGAVTVLQKMNGRKIEKYEHRTNYGENIFKKQMEMIDKIDNRAYVHISRNPTTYEIAHPINNQKVHGVRPLGEGNGEKTITSLGDHASDAYRSGSNNSHVTLEGRYEAIMTGLGTLIDVDLAAKKREITDTAANRHYDLPDADRGKQRGNTLHVDIMTLASNAERAVQIAANRKARRPFLAKINEVRTQTHNAADEFVRGLNPDGNSKSVTQYNA